jgi:hypothetical protein
MHARTMPPVGKPTPHPHHLGETYGETLKEGEGKGSALRCLYSQNTLRICALSGLSDLYLTRTPPVIAMYRLCTGKSVVLLQVVGRVDYSTTHRGYRERSKDEE